MIYSTAMVALKTQLNGIAKDIQAHDKGALDWDDIRGKFKWYSHTFI